MAGLCGLPVRKLGVRPGSLGSYAGVELGVPIITLELPRNASDLSVDELWGRYGPSLVAAVLYPDEAGATMP
jgi:protein MpaA